MLDVSSMKRRDHLDDKLCFKCNETYPATTEHFYKAKTKDGLQSSCKYCERKRAREHREKNKDYYINHFRSYYEQNKDKVLTRQKQYRKENWDKRAELHNQWVENNPDKYRVYNKRKYDKLHAISDEEWVSCLNYFDNSCAYCGVSEKEHQEIHGQNLHREHVYPDGSNGLDNCVPACKVCNSRKWQYDFFEWYSPDNVNFSEVRFFKIIDWIKHKHTLVG